MLAILLDAANKNLLLGFVPESLGLLVFGAALVASAVGLRRVFKLIEEKAERKS